MNYLSLVVVTANILGSFNDPFEFEGNYGDAINPVRNYVFEQVVSKEALAVNSSEQVPQTLIEKAVQEDLQHGPTLNELVTPELIEAIVLKQHEIKSDLFTESDLQGILKFVERYGRQKPFSFMRHIPSELLGLDKILRDMALREGRSFDLPIVSSTFPLEDTTISGLKERLVTVLFTLETLNAAKPQDLLQFELSKYDSSYLQRYLGPQADISDLYPFTSPAGQIFFYWLYQSLNLQLVAIDDVRIDEINRAKKLFADTLGNPLSRAQQFREKLIASNACILFTQECDTILPELLTNDNLFHPIAGQNASDGTVVFLRSDVWEPDYEPVPIDTYDGYHKGRLNVILATRKGSGEKFLLASCHGNSTRSEDGRLQISKVMEKFLELRLAPSNEKLQLIIGIDANTKSEEDVALLHGHLNTLGLHATETGPTTVKRRMVTAQHSKAGRPAVDVEDFIITLNPHSGGYYQMANVTVGFKEEAPDPADPLPNLENPSDHYPVGATLISIY